MAPHSARNPIAELLVRLLVRRTRPARPQRGDGLRRSGSGDLHGAARDLRAGRGSDAPRAARSWRDIDPFEATRAAGRPAADRAPFDAAGRPDPARIRRRPFITYRRPR